MFPTADQVIPESDGRSADEIVQELNHDALEVAGDLYAREELAERRERTEAAIRRAQSDV